MSTILVVNNVPYEFPSSGADPDWAPAVIDWATAVTAVLSSVSSTGDIVTTTFSLAATVPTPTNILGFSFDGTLISGFIAEYSISSASGTSETGHLLGTYNTSSGTWELVQTGNNIEATGIKFTITTLGQIQYTNSSSDICLISFRARGLKI